MVVSELETMMVSLEPLLVQLQQMELELKCRKCLKMLSSPILMRCGHLFCCSCVAASTETLKCPMCMLPCLHKDVMPAGHIENMINIHKKMSSILDTIFLQQGPSLERFETKIHSSKKSILMSKNAEEKIQENADKTTEEKSSTADSFVPVPGNLNTGISLNEAHVFELVAYERNTNALIAREQALVDQRESYSSPSFGTRKHSDHERNTQTWEPSTKRSATKRLSIKGLQGRESMDTKEDNLTEPKKHKPCTENRVRASDIGTHNEDIMKSDPKSGNNHEGHSSSYQARTFESPAPSILFDCAFCHSFRTTEGTGEMLHYLDGEQVKGDQVSQPNVMHAHFKCLVWAPQVYFEEDTALNLRSELSRASKIKCSHCGLKGAALGCFVKSCRKSFHVPCAFGMPGCRWDYENFHLLCPAHASTKLPCDNSKMLPCDESKKKKLIKACDSLRASKLSGNVTLTTEQCYENLTPSPWATQHWNFCGSDLSQEEKHVFKYFLWRLCPFVLQIGEPPTVLLEKFASLTGAEVTNSWNESVTHVIAATNEHGACSRTLKFLMAILTGKWILSVNWIKACMEAGHPIVEEPYEISHDIHGFFDGPKKGRIRAREKVPKLFTGLRFSFSGYFDPCYKSYLEKLISAGGGALQSQNSNNHSICSTNFVVFSADPPEGYNSDEVEKVIVARCRDAEALAAQTGSKAIAHTWILDTVSSCSLQQ